MKHRKYRILSILLLACLALQVVIPGAWAEAAPEGWETLAPAETAAPEEGTDPAAAPEGPTDALEVTEEPTAPPQEETEPEATEEPTEAPEPTEPEPTEPDPLEGYTFPDNWAREPLMFAVRNGILQGRGDYNLDPTGRTTRAEMAAMLVRLLGAKEQGDLSPYRDLDPAAWYNRELSAAVSLGIFNGVSATQMAPMRSITRQEAFTVLARAFGLYPQNRRAYTRFRDGEKVQPYARDAVSALAEVGCVTGYDTGYLKPRDPISRQEVAALFYKLLDQICDDPQELPETGFVLYRGTEPLPQGYRLEGSLVLGAGLSGSQTVTGIQVTDRLILRCATGAELTLEAVSAGEVSVASCLTATGEGTFPRLVSAGSGAEVALDAVRLEVFGPGVFSGDYETASVHCSGAVLSGEVDRLTATAAGATVEVRGGAPAHGADPAHRLRLCRKRGGAGPPLRGGAGLRGAGGSGGLGPGGPAGPGDRHRLHLCKQPQSGPHGKVYELHRRLRLHRRGAHLPGGVVPEWKAAGRQQQLHSAGRGNRHLHQDL